MIVVSPIRAALAQKLGRPVKSSIVYRLLISPKMNTEVMGAFLIQVSTAHSGDFIVMILDGASSHVAKALLVPKNITLIKWPPYAPQLNPQEHIGDEVREKEFPNRVFSDMALVYEQLEAGLPKFAADTERMRSITAWPWIRRLILKAN